MAASNSNYGAPRDDNDESVLPWLKVTHENDTVTWRYSAEAMDDFRNGELFIADMFGASIRVSATRSTVTTETIGNSENTSGTFAVEPSACMIASPTRDGGASLTFGAFDRRGGFLGAVGDRRMYTVNPSDLVAMTLTVGGNLTLVNDARAPFVASAAQPKPPLPPAAQDALRKRATNAAAERSRGGYKSTIVARDSNFAVYEQRDFAASKREAILTAQREWRDLASDALKKSIRHFNEGDYHIMVTKQSVDGDYIPVDYAPHRVVTRRMQGDCDRGAACWCFLKKYDDYDGWHDAHFCADCDTHLNSHRWDGDEGNWMAPYAHKCTTKAAAASNAKRSGGAKAKPQAKKAATNAGAAATMSPELAAKKAEWDMFEPENARRVMLQKAAENGVAFEGPTPGNKTRRSTRVPIAAATAASGKRK